MLYGFLKTYVGLILKIFFRDYKVTGEENIPKDKAVLYAAFHPNSFLDAMVLDVQSARQVWSLARGDAFKREWVRRFLHKLCMMPIFRISEGKENLGKNDETFVKCSEVFINNGQVQIFSEGLCKNQTELLPLKKGTARLVLQAWNAGIDLTVIPTANNYSHYNGPGKKAVLNYGQPIKKEDFDDIELTGANVLVFNQKLKEGLEAVITRDFNFKTPNRWIYYIFSPIHFPLFLLLKPIVKSRTKGTVFYDSVFVAFLVLALPIYWLLLAYVVCALV